MIVKHLAPELVHYLEDAPAETREEVAEEPKAEVKKYGEYLKYGIAVEEGLHYSTGNMDVYLDLIGMFVKDQARVQKLDQYRAENNMNDYAILVHSLKGNARTLGAHALADIAFEHEKESRAGNGDFVNAHWDKLVELWNSTKEGLALIYREFRGEDILKEETVSEESGEALEISAEELAGVAEMIDNFESDKAAAQLKTWLKSPLPKETRDLIKSALTALEDEFDEGRAMKLLKQEQ